MKTVSSIILPYSSTFYSLLPPFFVLEIFKFKYDKFFSDILLPFTNSNDLNSRVVYLCLPLNALHVAMCFAQYALLGIVSIYEVGHTCKG